MDQDAKPNCTADELYSFVFRNQQICGYCSIFLCVIGTLFNSLVILVYTRKDMISSMNTMFTHVAIVDILAMVSWLPYTWHNLIRSNLYSIKDHRTKFWETVSYISYFVTGVFTYTSVTLALAMALWRYIAIVHPLKERHCCNMRRTRIAILACYAAGFTITLPAYFSTGVEPRYKILDNDGFLASSCHTGNRTIIYEGALILKGVPLRVGFLFYGLVVKTAPSVFLTVMIYKIIIAIHKAKKRHRKMTETSTTVSSGPNSQHTERERQTNRITKILLIILGLFIIGEIPHGICTLLSVILGKEFFIKYYYPSSQIFNSIRVFCTSIHFVVYYSLNEQFRTTFKALFKCKTTQVHRPSVCGMSNPGFTSSIKI